MLLRPALIALSLALAVPAAGQDLTAVVIVNNAAVTRYEIDQRLRMSQVLRAPTDDAGVERDLIDERLKVQEARRLGITASPAAIREGMTEFASRANLDADGLIALLGQAGVDPETFRDFVAAGIVWREVLRARVAPAIRVSDRDIDQAMKRVLETPKVTEVLISELIMPAPPGTEDRVRARAEEIIASTRSEADFAAAARRNSATASAGAGGRLPWTPVASLPQGLAPILLALKPGQVTQPLGIPGAVVLFYLRDTRGVQRPGATAEVVEYARVTVASAQQAASLATAESCDMLEFRARGVAVERATGAPGAVPQDVAIRLASLDANEAVVVDRGGAADVIMLCRRAPALLEPTAPLAEGAPVDAAAADADPLPDRARVRAALIDAKVTRAEAALLAELRANAIIRRR